MNAQQMFDEFLEYATTEARPILDVTTLTLDEVEAGRGAHGTYREPSTNKAWALWRAAWERASTPTGPMKPVAWAIRNPKMSGLILCETEHDARERATMDGDSVVELCDAATVEAMRRAALSRPVAASEPVAWEILDKDGAVMLDHPFRSREAAESVKRECETWRWPARAPFTLRPLHGHPLPIALGGTEVETARRAFYEAARAFGAILDHRDRIYGSLDDPAFVRTYRALLAAERDAALRREKGGDRG